MQQVPDQKDNQMAKSPAWRRTMRFYTYLKPGIWLMKLPLLGTLLQRAWIREDEDANWFIPIGEAVPMGERYVLPGAVLERLLREAEGIFAMAACPCRTAFKCGEHPRNFGCLQLGPATRELPPELGSPLTLEEGLAHLERGISSGLTPTILHMASEAENFRVDKARMLSVCFCCECCCDVRLLLREGPDRYWDLYNQRLPGVEVVVDGECTLCGDCVDACYGGERVIRLGEKRAQIGERCIGCGKCVPACPEGAISLHVVPGVDVIEALLERVGERTKIR